MEVKVVGAPGTRRSRSDTGPHADFGTLAAPATAAAADHVPGVGRSAWWLPSTIVAQVGPRELKRRVLHTLPGFMALGLLPIEQSDPLSPTLLGIIVAATLGISTFSLLRSHRFSRQGESSMIMSIVSYAAVTLSMVVLLPAQLEVAFGAVAILAFGDGSATFAGKWLGGRKLPWNPHKSWAGSLAFLGVSIPMATLIYWGEAQPAVPAVVALACVAPAALIAALAESLHSPVNDNVRVGLAAAVTILATHGIFVGW